MKRMDLQELGSGAARRLQREARRPGTVARWNDVALEAIRIGRPEPAAAVAALAVVHGALYNAWAAYDGAARQTTPGRAVRLPGAERDAASRTGAMAHAAWTALSGCFPAQAVLVDLHMASLGLDPAVPAGPLSPAGIGRAQAAAMLDAWRAAAVPFAPAVLALERRPPAACPAPLHCWTLARQLSQRQAYGDDQDVLLYFALAQAQADALFAGACAEAAAAEVLRRFGGGSGVEPGCERGKKVGALVFERARRYWAGRF